MSHAICVTCGTNYGDSDATPTGCLICQDERQYVGLEGQRWTTLPELRAGHSNRITAHEPGLLGIGSEPAFAISQRALLVQTPAGNVLWDCISLIDEATVAAIEALGGITAIAISHPHFYSSMVEWSTAFGNVPIYLHAANREWVMHHSPYIRYWDGPTQPLVAGVTLVHCGGHFAGAAVLHWAQGAGGKGALLTADTITVVPDRRYVSFMRSYPNLIPLAGRAVGRIVDAVKPFAFDRIYGAWWTSIVDHDAKTAVIRSAERYQHALAD